MSILKSPLEMGKLRLRNRLVMPAMETGKGDDGFVTDRILDYYDSRTRGGALGLVITEHAYVTRDGIAAKGQIGADSDDKIPGLTRIAEVIHGNDTAAIAQISHAGSASPIKYSGLDQPVAPSAVINPGAVDRLKALPRELTLEEIGALRELFVAAALRMEEAGFDGVELHSAHGYLLSQFYSPLTNQREDQYGYGSVAGRLRLQVEIAEEIRKRVHKDFLIGIRLGACDYNMEGGSTLSEVAEATVIMAEHFDFIDISGGLNGVSMGYTKEPGYFSDASRIVKEHCDLPVMLTGGIRTAAEAESLLERGATDLIGLGRPLFKQADAARRLMEGAE